MIFFADIVCQGPGGGKARPPHAFLSQRGEGGSLFLLSSGMGPGPHKAFAAEACAARLGELYGQGVPLGALCESMAAALADAVEGGKPSAAFLAVLVSGDGGFQAHSHGIPAPILIRGGGALALEPMARLAGLGALGGLEGRLRAGDSLLLWSPGGGGRFPFGGGAAQGPGSLAAEVQRLLGAGTAPSDIPGALSSPWRDGPAGAPRREGTFALILPREARVLTLLSGPPSRGALDAAFARGFMARPGRKAACGSSTVGILARELGREPTLRLGEGPGEPPEYLLEGVDLATEGAATLSGACDALGGPPGGAPEGSPVGRLCRLLREADAIHLMIGTARNPAHDDPLFARLGVRPREGSVRLLALRLRDMGKIVTECRY